MPGIDDMSFYIPKIFLPIEELADHRNISYEKLNKGLGLEAMSLTDVHEDVSTMATNAVYSLIKKNNLSPKEIGRIYVGSESATDGAKPIASYVLSMLAQCFEDDYGKNAWLHTDVVDMTFACIAGVDALHNTLDWVRADTSRVGIVVCTDDARYELESTGEYTQGAGAVAMLINNNPRLMSIECPVGVATVGVHDFFKPVRRISRKELAETMDSKIKDFSIPNILSPDEQYLEAHKIFPVFDGQYSNECYAERMKEAYKHFKQLNANHQLDNWDRIVFHLPYAFHGKRVFSEIFFEQNQQDPELAEQLTALVPQFSDHPLTKLVAKTSMYKQFVKEKIEKGQRASSLTGNLYTASIFMSLMSLLESELDDSSDLKNQTFGFCSYGSGSKSKIFEGTLHKEWKAVVNEFNLFNTLSERKAIDFETYEQLHNGVLTDSIFPPENEFYLKSIATLLPNKGTLSGERKYAYGETAFSKFEPV